MYSSEMRSCKTCSQVLREKQENISKTNEQTYDGTQYDGNEQTNR